MAKEDPEVKSISTEACFAVTKAVVRSAPSRRPPVGTATPTPRTKHTHTCCPPHPQELLLEAMAQRAGEHVVEAKRASLDYGDVGERCQRACPAGAPAWLGPCLWPLPSCGGGRSARARMRFRLCRLPLVAAAVVAEWGPLDFLAGAPSWEQGLPACVPD